MHRKSDRAVPATQDSSGYFIELLTARFIALNLGFYQSYQDADWTVDPVSWLK